ncbi:VF530 family protein [Novipirellula rosea]|uniref:DUF2132 domain-containing protein n=1 Tax=Novipirellula rosea TaxID=1031540 RepID=A0ABP8M4X0_9BACT
MNPTEPNRPLPQPNNPLHGVTLESMLNYLVSEYGWEELGQRIRIRCFSDNPSIKSSLKFLRKTDWARTKVEGLYLHSIRYDDRHHNQRSDQDESPRVTPSVWDQARRK